MLNDSVTYLWTMIAGWVTATATAGLVVGAILAWHTAKRTLRQMEADSEAQARPYLTAEVIPSLGGPPSWDLVVRNLGRSAATDVHARFCPPPSNPEDEIVREVTAILGAGGTIAPSSTLRLYWRLGETPGATKVSGADGFVDDVSLVLTYAGVNGKSYTETFPLRAASMTPLPDEGPQRSRDTATSFEERQRSALIRAVNSIRSPW